MSILKAQALVKDYQLKNILINAIKGVDLSIEAGEFTAIVGPSGSGKSTLLHLLSCLDTPTSGNIFVEDKEVGKLNKDQLALLRRGKIGFIFQAYNLIPVLTAFENVSLPLTLLGYSKPNIKEITNSILKKVGLEGLENRKPAEMSGGQQQRVAIARAIAKKPMVVVADEPTANIDSKTAQEILELMVKLNKENGITFLFSTHDKLVMGYAKRIINLKDGVIAGEDKNG